MPALSEDKPQRYFIAIVPPIPIYDEVREHKVYFKEQYNSKASLNSPPHITLHMPFQWKLKKEDELVDSLTTFFSEFEPLTIDLNKYSTFPPRVIFINVHKSAALENLQRELIRFCKRELGLFNANYKEQVFHPHLTLAFRDLKKPNYQRAWDEFASKNYQASFATETISLLKHNGKVWEVFKDFKLSNPVS